MTGPDRIVIAVDDSPAALAAARLGVEFAGKTGACVRFVHVIGDGALVRGLGSLDRAERLEQRRTLAAQSLLDHVRSHAHHAGVVADTVSVEGDPAARILTAARDWQADLIVIGRSDVPGTGRPYVGSVTRNVLEFSDCPVLVVPRPE